MSGQPATRWRSRPWPWPGDSREDKAKRVGLSYRGLVQTIAAGQCEDPSAALQRLDEHWADLGVHWHLPRPDLLADADDEWMSARDLAHAIDRTRKDIYNWSRAGHVRQRASADGTPEYSVSDVVAYSQSVRLRRIGSD